MSRFQRRASRLLIAALAIVVVCGGAFYFHNIDGKSVSRKAAMASPNDGLPALVEASRNVAVTPADVATPVKPATLPTTAPNTLVKTSTVDGHHALSEGLAQKAADDLLSARTLLNEALFSGQLTAEDTSKCKAALGEVSQVVVFGPKQFGDDAYGGTYTVQPGELLRKIADKYDVTWEFLCRINNISDPKRLRANQTIKVIKGPFFAVVDKNAFTMELYLGAPPTEKGSMYVTTFKVGLGRDDSTPTGVWLVEPHKKIKNPTYFSPRGEGVIDAGDPKNPLGGRWIGLSGVDGHAVGKQSYGVHGTIEPDSIGKMASMGCIRMRNEDVERVFEMLVEGKSTVTVK